MSTPTPRSASTRVTLPPVPVLEKKQTVTDFSAWRTIAHCNSPASGSQSSDGSEVSLDGLEVLSSPTSRCPSGPPSFERLPSLKRVTVPEIPSGVSAPFPEPMPLTMAVQRTLSCCSSVIADSDDDTASSHTTSTMSSSHCSAFDGVLAYASSLLVPPTQATRRPTPPGASPSPQTFQVSRRRVQQKLPVDVMPTTVVQQQPAPLAVPSLVSPTTAPQRLSFQSPASITTDSDSGSEVFCIPSGNPFGRVHRVSATEGCDGVVPSTPSAPVATPTTTPTATPQQIKRTLVFRRKTAPNGSPVDQSLTPTPSPTVPSLPTPPSPARSQSSPVSPPQASPVWRKGAAIGEGSFGKVFRYMNSLTGEIIAVKQLPLSSGDDPHSVESLMREVNVLSSLHHDNIVRYVGAEQEEYALNVQMEYVCGGSLRSIVDEFGAFDETIMKGYLKQVLTGLAYLHDQMIVHGDVKCGNALVNADGVVKLTDFGCSRVLREEGGTDEGKALRGTVPFMAPEVIRQIGSSTKSDIWSVGCMVIEMATGASPWTQFSNKLTAMFHIASSAATPQVPEHLSHGCKAFLSRCLQRNPTDRASAAELLCDPWLCA